MTTEQIEKAIKKAAAKLLTAETFGRQLAESPYCLTPPEATKIMYEYRKRFPNLQMPLAAVKTKPLPIPPQPPITVAKTTEIIAESNYKQSIINRSAVKSFALTVAKEKRNGKFERVSTHFVQGVEADVEAVIRGIGPADDRDIPCNVDFLNRKAIRPKVEEKLNDAIRKIIIRKVCSHPTMGKTLK